MAMSRIRPLDGLRACAALSVLSYHVAELTGFTRGSGLGAVLSQLKAGVPIFFVISGFILYLPWARAAREGTPRPAVAGFARRRAARIVPAYWVALTVWLAILAIAAGAGPNDQWIGDYGLVQIYSLHSFSAGLGPAWSLCVEFTFYLALPALGWALSMLAGRVPASTARRQLTMIGVLAAASLGVRIGVSGSLIGAVPVGHAVLATALPSTFDWFAVGLAIAVLAAEWSVDPSAFRPVRCLAASPGACWLAGALLLGGAVPLQGGDVYVMLDSVVAHVMIGLGAGLLLLPIAVPAAAARPSRLLATLGGSRMAWLGEISYGIFLYNLPVLVVVRALLFSFPVSAYLGSAVSAPEAVSLWLVVVAGSVGLGALSWSLVERPAQRWAGHRPAARPRLETTQSATASSIAR
jgi:peptidoglycan/LPS O-acetylase OafA/YrhL